MSDYLTTLLDQSDIELSKRLRSILTVRSLVEVRNQLEQRITHYFDNNVREQNKVQSHKFCHNLLDQIYSHYTPKLQDLVKVQSVQSLR